MDIDRWVAVGRDLESSPAVHRPSSFSALLAATMGDCGGKVVIDAGCGAGLVTLAALSAGAVHVVAQDYDPAALADTARNVERFIGPDARRRLSLWEADWSLLGPMRADLLAVNPPQRPSSLLPEVDPELRHLHEGGGQDGLDGMRLVLAHAGATRVRTTAAGVLKLADAEIPGWSEPLIVASAEIPYDAAWRTIVPSLRDRVSVWEFERLKA